MKNLERFTFKIGDEEKEFIVRKPTAKQLRGASTFHSIQVSQALQKGLVSRVKMQEFLEKQEIWTDEHKKRLEEIRDNILNGQKALQAGGIKLSEARALAFQMKKDREEFNELLRRQSTNDGDTAEGFADNERFNYLLVECLVYNSGEKVFKNIESLYELSEQEDYANLAGEASKNLLLLMADLTDSRDKLPENAFLKKYGFINEKYQIIDKQGRLVDEKGRLLNEEGRFINEAGELVDIHGNRVDQDGNYVVESKPFLDDEGNPLA